MTTSRFELSLVVAGRLGPYNVLTEEAVRGLADRLSDGAQIPVRLPSGELRLGTVIAGTVEVVETQPDRFLLKAAAMLRTDDAAPVAGAAAFSTAVGHVIDERTRP